MRGSLTALTLLALGALLGGCHWRHAVRDEPCGRGEPYTRAQSVPPVKSAEGLSPPNTRNALKIPDVPTAMKPRLRSEGCLDQPPSFFPGRPKPGEKEPALPRAAAKPGAAPAAPAAPAPAESPPPAVEPPPAPAPVPK